jgi:hypothetical protein
MADQGAGEDDDFRGISEDGELRIPRADTTSTIVVYMGAETGKLTEETEKFMNDLCKKSKAEVWYDWSDFAEACTLELDLRKFHYIFLPELIRKIKDAAARPMVLANREKKSDFMDAIQQAISYSSVILTETEVFSKITDVLDFFPDANLIFHQMQNGHAAFVDMQLSHSNNASDVPAPKPGARIAIRGLSEYDDSNRSLCSGVALVLQKRDDWVAYIEHRAKERKEEPMDNTSFTFSVTCKDEGNVCLKTDLEFPCPPDRDDFNQRVMDKLRQADINCLDITIKVLLRSTSQLPAGEDTEEILKGMCIRAYTHAMSCACVQYVCITMHSP